MSYDDKCYELAESFLSDKQVDGFNTFARRDKLAQAIQDTIEDFLNTELPEAK